MTFRVQAPNATTVTVAVTSTAASNGSGLPLLRNLLHRSPIGRGGVSAGGTMTKARNGIGVGTTVRRVKPGAWRYSFTLTRL